MSCVYCSAEYSSQIEHENNIHGDPLKKIGLVDPWFKPPRNKDNDIEKMTEKLWDYLRENDRYKKLRRYHILGGEPFLLQELDQSIDFFEKNPNPDLVFSLVTNLNIPPKIIEKYIDRFKSLVDHGSIWKLQITGSLDCWAPEQEYVRYGLDLDTWEKNFTMFAQKPWASMSINSALSSLTLPGLPALIDKIKEWNKLLPHGEKILWSSNITTGPTSPTIFGPGYFEDYFVEAISMLKESNLDSADALSGLKSKIEASKKDTNKIKQLQDYLSELDRRRGTNWRKMFSWLDKDFT